MTELERMFEVNRCRISGVVIDVRELRQIRRSDSVSPIAVNSFPAALLPAAVPPKTNQICSSKDNRFAEPSKNYRKNGTASHSSDY